MAEIQSFEFMLSAHMRFGPGISEKLGQEAAELMFSRPAVIIDKGIMGHTQVKKVLEGMAKAALTPDVLRNDAQEPTYEYLELFRGQCAGKGYDCLVGIGGGSTLDLSKGVAALLTNEGPAISFRGFPALKHRPLPVIAVPTTAGSGSEATYNAVFTDDKDKRRLGINSILNFPVRAFIDPLFTVNCPRSVTVSSGGDALVHAIECYVSKINTPVSRMYSKEGFRLLFNNLMKVLDDPGSIEIRAALALGAYLAAVGLLSSGGGPCGALSYPLGAVYKVPHGFAGAVFLAPTVALNAQKGYTGYAELYELIDGADKTISAREKSLQFARQMRLLMERLGILGCLKSYKLGGKDIDFMASQYDLLLGSIGDNPVEITKEDIARIVQEAV